jgi:hypothetical protein
MRILTVFLPDALYKRAVYDRTGFFEPPVIETDLTDEKNAMIEESLAEYRADPSSVTPWRKVRRSEP